jgi:AhpD family alkylhydroperoxidase
MLPVINVYEKGNRALQALYGLGHYLSKSPVEQSLLHLIYYRVSQLNGCAFCLDMHSKDLLATGDTAQRLLVLPAWRETPFFSDRERAALAWAEALTTLGQHGIPKAVYTASLEVFSEEELIDITFAVITINSYNRVNLAFPNPAAVGTYAPGQYAAQ